MYKLSIVIPIYNMEKELKDALNSIVNQTMDLNDIEVIMVNDCSTDGSKMIMEEYCRKYDNFKSIHLNENTGSPSIPRNIGIENASSEYIQFLDADDTLVETACDFLYDTITKEDVDLVSGYIYKLDRNNNANIDVARWFSIIDDDDPSFKLEELLESDELCKFQFEDIRENPRLLLDYGFYNKIYKRSLILENDIFFPNVDGGEDAVFLYNYMINSKGIIFANRPVVLYNQYRQDSLSKSKSLKTLSNRPKAYMMMYDLAVEKDMVEDFVKILLYSKLDYWLKVHVFNAFPSTNEEIMNILKEYKILFDECIKYDVGFDDVVYGIVNDIYRGDYEDAIKRINIKRFENSDFSNTFIISLPEGSQLNDISDSDFNFKDSELILVNPNGDSINEINENSLILKCTDSIKSAIENSLGRNVIFINSLTQFNDMTYKLSRICGNNDLDIAFAYDSKQVNDDFNEEDCSSIVYGREFIQDELNDCESGMFANALQKTCNYRAIDIKSLDEIYSNQENCKVSVIMPVYNAGRYLEESINCVLNQTLKEIELICVDDGSQDNSVDILQRVADEDNRMHFYRQNHNGGGAARNFALKKATGKYLYFMDADDLIKQDALRELYDKIEESEVDFVLCRTIVYDSDNDEYLNKPYFDMEPIYRIVGDEVFHYNDVGSNLFDFSVTPWAKMFNREFALSTGARFGEGLIFHDHFFFWEILFNSRKIIFYNKELCIYRIHSKSSTESKDSRFLNIFDVYKGVIEIFMKYHVFNKYERRLYNVIIHSAIRRYFMIQNEYQSDFFYRMKNEFAAMKSDVNYEKLPKLLNSSNKILFDSVLECENMVDFNISILDKLGFSLNVMSNKNKKLKRKNRKLKKDYKAILSSSSWRITAPLRKIRNFRK